MRGTAGAGGVGRAGTGRSGACACRKALRVGLASLPAASKSVPACPFCSRARLRAAESPDFGHGTAFWHRLGTFRRRVCSVDFADLGFFCERSSFSVGKRRIPCQNAVPWPKSAYLPHGEARQMPFQASPSLRACLLLVRHFGGRRGPMPRLRRLSRGVECERLSRGGASFAPHPSSPPRFGFARCPAPLILAPSKRRKDGRCRIGCEGLPMGALSPSHQARDSATCPFRDASGGLRPKAARRGAGASSLVVLSGVFDEPDEGLGLRFEA